MLNRQGCRASGLKGLHDKRKPCGRYDPALFPNAKLAPHATAATPPPLDLNKLRWRGVSRSGGTHEQPKPHRKVKCRRQALLLELPRRRCNDSVKAEYGASHKKDGTSQKDVPVAYKGAICYQKKTTRCSSRRRFGSRLSILYFVEMSCGKPDL